jgi:hypothetical protein
MTTLRARWEKPDYTGVTAEVPLGHIPHPKISPANTFFSRFSFRKLTTCLNISRVLVNHRMVEIITFLKTGF